MQLKPLNIGFLFTPSIRSLAYLNLFRNLRVFPTEVIIMDGEITVFPELITEDEKFGYSHDFFDLHFNINDLIDHNTVNVIKVKDDDVNSTHVHCALEQLTNKYFIFCGGGILSKETLSLNKLFIHSHPGLLPHYSGSTCFYYSILNENHVGATVFVMNEKIDQGEIVSQSKFEINYCIKPGQRLFMDYILDPYIRAFALGKALNQFMSEGRFIIRPQNHHTYQSYYVMHPLLRHLAINTVNALYDEKSHTGISPMSERIPECR